MYLNMIVGVQYCGGKKKPKQYNGELYIELSKVKLLGSFEIVSGSSFMNHHLMTVAETGGKWNYYP